MIIYFLLFCLYILVKYLVLHFINYVAIIIVITKSKRLFLEDSSKTTYLIFLFQSLF